MKYLLAILTVLSLPSFAKSASSESSEKIELSDYLIRMPEDFKTSLGGGITSIGGGDFVNPSYSSAWFYGDKEIKVCSVLSSNFGLSQAEVQAALKRVLLFWRQQFAVNTWNNSFSAEHKINVNFKYGGSCVGGEDLDLFLGTGPIFGNLSDRTNAGFYRQPVAYPNKTHIYKDLKWSQGYILVNKENHYKTGPYRFPQWNQLSQFEVLLAHEFGHVLGFGHKDQTLMSAEVVLDLFFRDEVKPKLSDFSAQSLPSPVSNFSQFDHSKPEPDASKESVNLLNNSKDIQCSGITGGSDFKSLWIEKDDKVAKITWNDSRVEEFKELEFLDTAVLMTSKLGTAMIFQTFHNGEQSVTIGELHSFREGNCNVSGHSKTCSVTDFTSMFWSPNRLEILNQPGWKLPVVEYSQYPNDGTHFTARTTGSRGNGLVLVDYGSNLQLIKGEFTKLNCTYVAE